MHNPNTEIARITAREPVRTRKPEQGTGPNVYYLGAEEAAINPELAVEELPHMTMWSTLLKPNHDDESEIDRSKSLRTLKTINPLKPYSPAEQQRRDPTQAHIVYDTPKNSAPWAWKASADPASKSLGAGTMIVAALALALYGLSGTLSTTMNALPAICTPILRRFFTTLTLV